jgi:hypothetical protein
MLAAKTCKDERCGIRTGGEVPQQHEMRMLNINTRCIHKTRRRSGTNCILTMSATSLLSASYLIAESDLGAVLPANALRLDSFGACWWRRELKNKQSN